MDRQHALRVVFTVFLLLVFVLTSVFNLLFETGGTDIFLNWRHTIYERYPTDALPSFYGLYWGAFILAWQTAWVLYSISLLCRLGPTGPTGSEGPRYLDPPLLSPLFLGLYALGNILYLGWSFSLDRNIVPLAFVMMLGAAVLFATALSVSHKTLYQERFQLAQQNRKRDDILVRVLVQNGIAGLVSWTLSRLSQTMSIMIAYWSTPPVNQETASIIALSFNFVIAVTFIILDITVIDKYTRYNFLAYISTIYLNSAVNDNSCTKVPAVIAALVMGSAASVLVIKIILGVQRNKTDPLFPVKLNVKDENAG